MKTIREWFSELEPVSRYKAIANTDPEILNDTAPTLSRAISMGFIWLNIPEGELYWRQVQKNIKY